MPPERRPGRRPGIKVTPNRALERSIRDLQREVSHHTVAAKEARQARDQVASVMFYEHGYSQQAIADLLSIESELAGDGPLTEDTVQKALQRLAKAS